MALKEVDAIDQAIIGTEREIAGNAWDIEDTDPADETGDRSLEAMGDGLEGQVEADDEDDTDGDDAAGESEADGDGEDDDQGDDAAGEQQQTQATQPNQTDEPKGRIPPGRLREEAEARRLAETERDQLRVEIAQLKTQGPSAELTALQQQLAEVRAQLQQMKPATAAPVQQQEAEQVPDIFEDPKGYQAYHERKTREMVQSVQAELHRTRVEASFERAHDRHQEAFPQALEAINKLNPNDPNDRTTVQRIYNSPNPGEALVQWHKRNETLARVGNDPAAYEARIREETRQALLKDPEFKKQLLADLRGEALTANDGQPRTTTRLPKSLARAGGSNLGVDRMDHGEADNSDQAVANSAWR